MNLFLTSVYLQLESRMNSSSITDKRADRPTQKLAARLRKEISSGVVPSGELLPGERSIARESGVAQMTARRALKMLQAEGLLVAEPRRGYRVLPGANDPDRGAPLAYVLSPHPGPELWDDLHKEFVAALQQAAALRGWTLLAVGTEDRTHQQIIEDLRTARVCGAILDTPSGELMAAIHGADVPTLVVDDWRQDLEIDAVVQDGFRGGLLAGSCLVEHGHQRIAWLGPIGVSRQGLERYGGASAALAARGLEITSELRRELSNPETPDGVEKARQLLTMKDRPTAILALWQGCVASLVKAAHQLDLIPGKDFEMIGWSTEAGYQKDFLSHFTNGPIPPAVVWDVQVLGQTAVSRLAERRQNPELPVIKLKVPTRLKFAEEL
jgi:LacI family transcriptional regulator, galactose operon repressor